MRPSLLLILAALTALAGCGSPGGKDNPDTLTVAATAVPHAEILEAVKPALAREGVKLDIRVFNDYVQPNTQVAEGAIAVNYFQTKPYLDEFNKARGTHLVLVAAIHVEPFAAYSRRWKSAAAIPQGADVVIPSDGSNAGRALLLLQKAGLITLRPEAGALASPRDILTNPRGLKIRELEAATLPRVLDQVDLALINTNYALDAGLNPLRDALFIEDRDSPYANYLVGLAEAANDPRVKKLVAALRSPETRAFIEQRYEGAVIPAS
ncbi:MetQ/NlpA family ABC transporter substrate-binding protein [Sandaracinobacter sp. RS1-74]|uniref:MetQ/NlpA family ABC transporter substrate-binding protein n=1 Tax=Sandaracinobacteroides sayramensis TaxID=2913411 RepID=UPI001EDA05B8|nr:MetQ/NlpA family ABC transporter substrate-binding protein [Sandaracinobacteroides sayramensis]MCG2842584.1 MetQ/NlpA family ABC transporter substrate-binding protein [Sandaracinobacteroides sayramensis]